MATRSSILPWEIPWAEEPGGLESMGLQKIQTQLVTNNNEASLVVQWLRLHFPVQGYKGLIPGRGTKIPHAVTKNPKYHSGASAQPNKY